MDLKLTKPVWKILPQYFYLVINSTVRCLSVIKTEDVSTFFFSNLFLGGFL